MADTVTRKRCILIVIFGFSVLTLAQCKFADAQHIPSADVQRIPPNANLSTPKGRYVLETWLRDHFATQSELNSKASTTQLKDVVKQDNQKHQDITKAFTENLGRKADTEKLEEKAGTTDLFKLGTDLTITRGNAKSFWVMLAALLVFFMQAGFLCLEVGMVRKEFGNLQAAYKLCAWIATYAGYYFSFALMFGITHGGWYGTLFRSPETVINSINGERGIAFFLFQAAFAATAVTIPSGSGAERMTLKGYFLMGLVIALAAYPLFGHWAWGGSLYSAERLNPDVKGWLQRLGFHDFAGSTVVHSVGGWFAYVAAWFLGQRKTLQGKSRFNTDDTINVEDFPSWHQGVASLGAFLLWFGWWGFNGGSHLEYGPDIAKTILHTNIAGGAAGLAAWLFARMEMRWSKQRKFWFKSCQQGFITEKSIGGILGGLVAITASCAQATPFAALLIGLSAGIIHNLTFDLLLWRKIDDPVGAIPVHLGCGIWGTLCVATTYTTFGVHGAKQLSDYGMQFAIQLLGVVVAAVCSILIAGACFILIKELNWLSAPDTPSGQEMLRNLEL